MPRRVLKPDELLEIMLDAEKVKALMVSPDTIFLESIGYGADGVTKTSCIYARLPKKELFEEGLLLLGKLPKVEQVEAINRLQNINIPSALWYKMIEENTSSSQPQSIYKEPDMNQTTNDTAQTADAAAPQTFWQAHGPKIQKISLLVLGVFIGAGINAAMNKAKPETEVSGSGSGE